MKQIFSSISCWNKRQPLWTLWWYGLAWIIRNLFSILDSLKTRQHMSVQRNTNLNLCQNSEMQWLCPVPSYFCLHRCSNIQERDGRRKIKPTTFQTLLQDLTEPTCESFVIPSDLEILALQLLNQWLGVATTSTGHNIVPYKDIQVHSYGGNVA